jgi:hypothetical protein
MIGNKKWFSSLTPLSHQEYVTFKNDKKGKVLGTGVIKVNDHFILNNVTLVDMLRYNLISVPQLVMLIYMCFFESMILEFLIQPIIWFVVFFGSEMTCMPISHLLSLP